MKEAVLRGGLFLLGRAMLRVGGRARLRRAERGLGLGSETSEAEHCGTGLGENELNQSLMTGFSDVHGARLKKKFEVEGKWSPDYAYLSR